MRPLIGLNMSLDEALMAEPLKARALCHLKYIDAVAQAGGVPVLVPPYQDRSMLDEILPKLDGFCLIGGRDYLPAHYGGHKQPDDDLMHPRRHQFDLWLAERLLEHTKKPVLGICGGHQLIAIARGGALVQDIRSEWKAEPHADANPSPQPPPARGGGAGRGSEVLRHSNEERKGAADEGEAFRHEVKLKPGSRVARIIGAERVAANSYHHQAVQPQRIGKGLVATAWAPDGVIEAIEAEDSRFVLGVQWHPERQSDEAPHRKIFEALVAAAGE